MATKEATRRTVIKNISETMTVGELRAAWDKASDGVNSGCDSDSADDREKAYIVRGLANLAFKSKLWSEILSNG